MNVFVLAILFYLLYRFIGGFLIPLFRTTSHMRQQFNDMNNQPHQDSQPTNPHSQGFGGQSGPRPTASDQHGSSNSGTPKVGEYIDFEEVK
jgi:hypothetical protein